LWLADAVVRQPRMRQCMLGSAASSGGASAQPLRAVQLQRDTLFLRLSQQLLMAYAAQGFVHQVHFNAPYVGVGDVGITDVAHW
jgi:hypothetical protein